MGRLDGKVAFITGGASDDASFVSGAAIAVDGAIPDGLFGSEERVNAFLAALGLEMPSG